MNWRLRRDDPLFLTISSYALCKGSLLRLANERDLIVLVFILRNSKVRPESKTRKAVELRKYSLHLLLCQKDLTDFKNIFPREKCKC